MNIKEKLTPLEKFNRLIREQEKSIENQKKLFEKRKQKEPDARLHLLLRKSNDLLRPSSGECEGWAFHVPRCFNSALDISYDTNGKIPSWKQGTSFSFSADDVITDVNIEGIELWSDCLKVIKRHLQIKTAASAGLGEDGENGFRYEGSVTFELAVPDEERKTLVSRGEITMTQDGFIRYLISGSLEKNYDL